MGGVDGRCLGKEEGGECLAGAWIEQKVGAEEVGKYAGRGVGVDVAMGSLQERDDGTGWSALLCRGLAKRFLLLLSLSW